MITSVILPQRRHKNMTYAPGSSANMTAHGETAPSSISKATIYGIQIQQHAATMPSKIWQSIKPSTSSLLVTASMLPILVSQLLSTSAIMPLLPCIYCLSAPAPAPRYCYSCLFGAFLPPRNPTRDWQDTRFRIGQYTHYTARPLYTAVSTCKQL